MENKNNAFADEVLEKVAGGDGDVVTVTWTCPTCKQEFTFTGPKWEVDMNIFAHRASHNGGFTDVRPWEG